MPYKDATKQRQWRRDYRKTVQVTKICEHCENEYTTPKDHRNVTRFCSLSCAGKSRKRFINIPTCLDDASRKLDKNLGYVRVYVPMHPEANTWGYVYEHRVIAEQMLNRNLEPREVVHHKNGLRWDNRPENLEVMDKIEHCKLGGQRKEDLKLIGEASLL